MAGFPQSFGIGAVQTLTDAATITLDLGQASGTIPPNSTVQVGTGNSYAVTLGGSRTLNILNMTDGQIIYLYVTQDGTGSRVLTVQTGGTAAVVSGTPLSTSAGYVDLVAIQYRADLGYAFYYSIGKHFI